MPNEYTIIGEIPVTVKHKLSILINDNESWKELAGNMGMTIEDIMLLRNAHHQPPSGALLDKIRHQPVDILYVHLHVLSFRNAMALLEPYVKEDIKNKFPVNVSSHVKDNNGMVAAGAHQSHLEHVEDNIRNVNVAEPSTKSCVKMQDIGELTDSNWKGIASLSRSPGVSNTISNSNMPNLTDESSLDATLWNFTALSYNDLETATDNWSQKNILGKSDSSCVFKGTFRGKQCAIKRLRPPKDDLRIALGSELRTLQRLDHPFLLDLYGFCEGSEHPCLIYPLMTNGSLEDYLQCENKVEHLTPSKKFDIAIDTTKALCYLVDHFKKPLVIKSSNIMLDTKMMPLVGDFCLPSMLPQNPSSAMKAYLPDDFERSTATSLPLLTFSMGVVLLELATDQRAYIAEEKYLKHEVYCNRRELVEKMLKHKSKSEAIILRHLLVSGLMCVPNRDVISINALMKCLVDIHREQKAVLCSTSSQSSKSKKLVVKA